MTRSSMPAFEEFTNEIKDIWESHWLTNMGIKHEALQKELVDYLRVENIELIVNGHFAIELSIQALHLHGEIITTPFTFASTTHAIVRNGCEPVFCDIDPSSYCIDVDKIESLITDKTVAIVPVHVYGHVCNVEEIERIANKYGLKVIYDAAHAFGVKYKNKGIGSFGDVSCFSFHATKVFNTIEGGCVCYHEKEFGNTLYKLKNFGIESPELVNGIGANAKMNEFCAAMGLCNLRHISTEIAKRKRIVERYRTNLGGVNGLFINPIQKDVEENYAYFPIVIEEEKFGSSRNDVFRVLDKNGVGARKYFYPLTSSFSCFDGKYDVTLTPVAAHISNRVLTLPLFADLPLDDVDKICEIILSNKK